MTDSAQGGRVELFSEVKAERDRLRAQVDELRETRPLTQEDAAQILGEQWAALEAENERLRHRMKIAFGYLADENRDRRERIGLAQFTLDPEKSR